MLRFIIISATKIERPYPVIKLVLIDYQAHMVQDYYK